MRSASALLGADVLLRGSIRQYVVLCIDPGAGDIEAHCWLVLDRAARTTPDRR
jgi:hypothetical protein